MKVFFLDFQRKKPEVFKNLVGKSGEMCLNLIFLEAYPGKIGDETATGRIRM